MEMIHSRSYTYIIKNVYPDASEVFDTVLDDDKIMQHWSQLLQHMTNSSMPNTNLIVVTHGNLQQKDTQQELMTGKNSKGNSTEQSSTLTFLKALGSMSPSLARLHLVNSKLWKDPLRLSLLSPEMKANILSLLNRSSKWQDGDDEEMVTHRWGRKTQRSKDV